jgi:hypothetical protein
MVAWEEFACLIFSGLRMTLDSKVPRPMKLGQGCLIPASPPFSLDDEWKRQLGITVSERIERFSNFVITAKGAGTADRLGDRVQNLLWGITAGVGVPKFESAYLVLGSLDERLSFHPGNRVSLRIDHLYRTHGIGAPHADPDGLQGAARFMAQIEKIGEEREQDIAARGQPFTPLYFRLLSGISAFQLGVKQVEPSYRHHQFVRAIESFLPANVQGKKQFADLTSTFLTNDPRNETTLLQMYDLRSAAEHHRPFDQRALPNESNPNEVAMQRVRQADTLVRTLYQRLLAGVSVNLQPFRDEASLNSFWSVRTQVLTQFGAPLDIQAIP